MMTPVKLTMRVIPMRLGIDSDEEGKHKSPRSVSDCPELISRLFVALHMLVVMENSIGL